MAAYRWKYFEENEDRPEKPRSYGVTEMRGPHYSLLSQNGLRDGSVVDSQRQRLGCRRMRRKKRVGVRRGMVGKVVV
ncbi:hypothetical protein DVH24_030992 [Malus domestica]|uniref:Uncharacterized protein n=1 Tax=Malus domestica TaxID=3750 RepID=A0A498HC99_MALDO|nr:hypothetical protein DVH24_030992 [Malus domestica]